MRDRQQKELRRLEEALMEAEYTEEAPADELEELDMSWLETADTDYDIYNTDDTDVDLDAYSEDVHQGKTGSGLSVVLTMLAMAALSACILLFLKYLGVL